MLINCPECELQVSDKAQNCPHCGYPMEPTATRKKRKSNRKRKRLPNGFGQISEIKNQNLTKPFRAMVTIGKTKEGKPISRLLKPDSYFLTYNDAYTALIEYNKNPYDLDDDIDVMTLYERWTEEYFSTLKSKSSERTITSAWKYCTAVYYMRARDIRTRHVKGCMEEGLYEGHTASASTKSRIKSLFNLMLDYALEYELVEKNYSRNFVLSDDIINEKETNKKGHISFTEDEMKILWDNLYHVQYVDVILVQCYSGWRPQELGLIEMKNVDLDNWVFSGGMKTSAGIDRPVPIHEKIRPLVKKLHNEAILLGSDFLINCTDATTHRSNLKMTYDKYQKRFNKIRDLLELNSEHRAHDPRKHFVTLAKKYELNEYAIKYLVGHSIQDITEKTYTEREITWLVAEMAKIE